MARLTDPMSADYGDSPARQGAQPVRRSLDGKFVCPFCGTINSRTDEPCPNCGMENTPATRNSTRGRVGPWYVLQKRNPAAPGMKFETLINFIRKGRIQPKAILRGPTTSQLWRFAATVKGVSREFGLCYNCGGDIDPNADRCPHCSRDQQPPADPNALLEAPLPGKPVQKAPPRTAEDDLSLESIFGAPSPVADVEVSEPPRPTKVPEQPATPVFKPAVPVTPAAAFSSVTPIQNVAPSNFPAPSREEAERREIEAGRVKREQEPRDPNKSAPTLSAKELATAFQLDFTPTNRKRRRKTPKSVIALLLLLIIGGAATWAWFKVPEFQTGVTDLYTQASTKIQALMQANSVKPATSSSPPLNNMTLQSKPTVTAPGQTPTPAANPTPIAPSTPVASTPPPAVPPPPAAPVVETPKPVVVAPPAQKLTLDEAYDLSRKLWRQALDSESRGDWADAVAAFEKIKTLPEKARPSSLDMRLAEAKAKLAQ